MKKEIKNLIKIKFSLLFFIFLIITSNPKPANTYIEKLNRINIKTGDLNLLKYGK